jgi:sugar transferase (PEP-CTERM system associated)
MLRIFGHFVPVPAVLLGIAEILLVAAAVYFVAPPIVPQEFLQVGLHAVQARFALGLSLIAGVSMMAVGLYNYDVFLDTRVMVIKVVMALTLVAPVAALGALVFGRNFLVAPSDGWSLLFLKVAFAWMSCVLVTRMAFLKVSDSDVFRRPVVVVGTGVRAARIANLVEQHTNRYFIPKAFVHACGDLRLVMGAPLDLDRTKDEYALARYARELGAREVVVATDERRGMPLSQLLHCKVEGINVVDYLTFWERENGRIEIESLQPSWLIYSDGFRLSPLNAAFKRVFDIITATGLLVFALPLMLIAALAVKFESPGPILYRQERVGLGGKPFTAFKFRSMRDDAERDGTPQWATQRDPRVTRVGGVIRKFRIDELPQLLNVLRGDMSFVGPRPERPFFVDQLSKDIPFYAERHAVKPGITGWAQVNYPYGASLEDAKHKLAYDLYYVKNRTLFLDLVIIVHTVRVILFREGAR